MVYGGFSKCWCQIHCIFIRFILVMLYRMYNLFSQANASKYSAMRYDDDDHQQYTSAYCIVYSIPILWPCVCADLSENCLRGGYYGFCYIVLALK